MKASSFLSRSGPMGSFLLGMPLLNPILILYYFSRNWLERGTLMRRKWQDKEREIPFPNNEYNRLHLQFFKKHQAETLGVVHCLVKFQEYPPLP